MTSTHRTQGQASSGEGGTVAQEPIEAHESSSKGAANGAGFPIVGIGASAGGLSAFEAFFSAMPPDVEPGMAFVLVQHLAPDHKSILADLIRRYTRMQVFEVVDGMPVQPNCAYIIPPNHDMALMNGALQLLEPGTQRGLRLSIDFFFRSLADDQRERAIGIVLSGTGSDGALGVRAIKAEGGMAMAQLPESAEFDGMPRSAIATGMIDYRLTPAEMPAQLIAYAAHAFGKLPRAASPTLDVRNSLQRIFILLRAQTGHDVSQYKPNTITRRIERRMAVHQIDRLDDYVTYLQQSPAEVTALFADLLIGVTNFFRDPEAFKVLEEQAIPELLAGKAAGATVRVWSPGCSTGEEAYSLAILLVERMEALRRSHAMQLFATDIDAAAIATARAGLYPPSIAADVSAERLARHFQAEPDGRGYRIHKRIRDMVVFSEQDVIRDPPFSRLDLVSCRNLLIYLGAELQKKLIPMFQYALNPGGFLFLGTSEGIGDFAELFAVVDRRAKLYRCKRDSPGTKRAAVNLFMSRPLGVDDALPRAGTPVPVRVPLREVTERALLQQVAPAAALVGANGDIFYLHGRTGMFLEPASGETSVNNVLKMAREGLRRELTTALFKAAATRTVTRARGLRVKTNGHFTTVDLGVHPVSPSVDAPGEAALFLVTLEEALPTESDATKDAAPTLAAAAVSRAAETGVEWDVDVRVAALQQDLRANQEYLQSANEELETANEELKCSNEEMQSVNEELQSTNEELETSREEMQSINEELSTVNAELQTKVLDWTRANNDLQNMLVGTGIATIFVDHQLRILRFTPAVTGLVNLIPADTGRPVGDLAAKFVGYDRFVEDVRAVLHTLVPREAEVQSASGAWFLMRIQPYRTVENVVEGAVISFVNITEIKRMQDALRRANELVRLAVVVRDAHDAITVQDLDGRIVAWNPGAVRLYGWTEAEALHLNVRDRIPASLQLEAVARLNQLTRAEVLEPDQTRRLTKAGAVVDVSVISTALMTEDGQMYAIATTERARDLEVGA